MIATSSEAISLQASEDIVSVRQCVRRRAVLLGFTLVDQTKIVTACSELGRNMLDYGGGGVVSIETVENGPKVGVRVVFEDRGPGIADIQLALTDGFTSGHGLGLGLGGAKRLSHEFEISSELGKGTRISILRWK
jgi:serine/threonine-protein kinase RsbT